MAKLPATWNPPQQGTVTAVTASTRTTAAGDTRVTAAGDTRITGTVLVTPKETTVWSAN